MVKRMVEGLNFRFATALRERFSEGYGKGDLRADLWAGITVGIVAIPLAMALAIASGVPPQYGLYTSIIGGVVIALSGGSRLSVSGPTAAFVVILQPIAVQFGVGGLVIATFMAGCILLLMGIARMGRLIQYIPYPVTTGFTAGIGVVIATLQVKDFLGLQIAHMPEHYLQRVWTIFTALPTIHGPDLLIGAVTLAILILWPRLKINFPGHLVAVVTATLLAWLLSKSVDGFHVATIGSRFSFELDGVVHQGIPQLPPLPVLPWHLPGPDGQPVGLSFALLDKLIGPAFAIAALGAIESLLCAVVIDGLSGTKHNPDTELLGQGLGNMVVPFFGGIAATGAIARTTANLRAGGNSPFAAVIHAALVLLAVVSLAPLMGYLPMAAMAALLIIVAWNMSEAKHFVNILRVAPKSDIVVLLACFSLTVIFDMVVAVGAGVVMAAFLFMRRMAEFSNTRQLERDHPHFTEPLPEHVQIYEIAGPLFFGAAEKAMSSLLRIGKRVDIVILDMGGVPVMDMTGLVALESIFKQFERKGTCVVLAAVQPQPSRVLHKAGIRTREGKLVICRSLDDALGRVRNELARRQHEIAAS